MIKTDREIIIKNGKTEITIKEKGIPDTTPGISINEKGIFSVSPGISITVMTDKEFTERGSRKKKAGRKCGMNIVS